MDVEHALMQLGGVARRRDLVALAGRGPVTRAETAGLVLRAGRTVHFPCLDDHARAAAAAGGVAAHLSAAVLLGVPVKERPVLPWITMPRHRRVRRQVRGRLVYADLGPDDRVGLVTSPLRTTVDCARRLPFDEALAIADGMLRRRLIDGYQLQQAAREARGTGSTQARRVAASADAASENPFESCLRAIALTVPEVRVRAQWEVDVGPFVVRPDVADPRLRIAMEADSWEFHTKKAAHDRDCERFSLLAAAGWTVLRFSWEQVMFRPEWVRDVITRTASRARMTDSPEPIDDC